MTNVPRIGVGVLVRRGSEVLLMKRANSHGDGTWSSPGGHLDYGETPEECAARETMEETGIVITDVTFIGITNDFFPVEQKHYVTVWMEAAYESGEAKVNAAYEMTEVHWFPSDDLPAPLFLPLQNLLTGKLYESRQVRGSHD